MLDMNASMRLRLSGYLRRLLAGHLKWLERALAFPCSPAHPDFSGGTFFFAPR